MLMPYTIQFAYKKISSIKNDMYIRGTNAFLISLHINNKTITYAAETITHVLFKPQNQHKNPNNRYAYDI